MDAWSVVHGFIQVRDFYVMQLYLFFEISQFHVCICKIYSTKIDTVDAVENAQFELV